MWIALMLGVALAAGPEALLEQGNRAYAEGDYAGAAAAWDELVDGGHASGDIYYNLGNAYYRAGDLGRAILSWRRAELLAPRDGDIEANLERARRETSDRLEAPSRVTPFFWREMLSLREQGLAAAWLLGLLLSLGVVQRLRPGLPLAIPALLTGAPAALLALGAWAGLRELERRPGAVVLADRVAVRSAAGDAAGVVVFELHEGAEVQVRERFGDYAQIGLPDDRRGWLEIADLGLVDPGQPMP